ncbi:putative Nucleic acid binding protein [Tripterygium wilfordii]|uniref:Putative Nucleic acid binding protein n=1 Tax=Tripterygium wilfordii TaxID=458696 RepID=A0A7J7C2V2_TRIWF|nr:putative Nucleic acid binding protein [Tripterygium wilfordii]
MWVLFNVNCGSKVRDVLVMPERRVKTSKDVLVAPERRQDLQVIRKQSSDGERGTFHDMIVRENYAHTMYFKLITGDHARNVIEIIFQRMLIKPFNPSIKIETILWVKNLIETLEKFERYREKVKKKACYEQYKSHPRCAADGNELLRFYGTTITCCSEKSITQVSAPCKDMDCRACRIIQSNFDTEHTRKNGILLSTSSEEVSDNLASFKKVKNIKRAVVVCRIIAGMTNHMTNEDCGLFPSEGQESLIVRNPCAVLPCFIIVFSTT